MRSIARRESNPDRSEKISTSSCFSSSVPSKLNRVSSRANPITFSTFLGSTSSKSSKNNLALEPCSSSSSSYVTAKQQLESSPILQNNNNNDDDDDNRHQLNSSSLTISNSNSFYVSAHSELVRSPVSSSDDYHTLRDDDDDEQEEARDPLSEASSSGTLFNNNNNNSDAQEPAEIFSAQATYEQENENQRNNARTSNQMHIETALQQIGRLSGDNQDPEMDPSQHSTAVQSADTTRRLIEGLVIASSPSPVMSTDEDSEQQANQQQIPMNLPMQSQLNQRRSSEGASLASLIQTACNQQSQTGRSLIRKNSIQMSADCDKLPPVTEGVVLVDDNYNLPQSTGDLLTQQHQNQRSGSLLTQINATKRQSQRRQSNASSAGGSQDNVASSANSLVSGSPPSSNSASSGSRRRRSSTTSQSSSVLSETSRQQLQFDLSPDLPLDSSLTQANALDGESLDVDDEDEIEDGRATTVIAHIDEHHSSRAAANFSLIRRPHSPEPQTPGEPEPDDDQIGPSTPDLLMDNAAEGGDAATTTPTDEPDDEIAEEIEFLEQMRDSPGEHSKSGNFDKTNPIPGGKKDTHTKTNTNMTMNNNNKRLQSDQRQDSVRPKARRSILSPSPSPSNSPVPSSLGGTSSNGSHLSSTSTSTRSLSDSKYSRDNCKLQQIQD